MSVEQTFFSSKVIPLLNAILCELQTHVVDDNKTQVPYEANSSAACIIRDDEGAHV